MQDKMEIYMRIMDNVPLSSYTINFNRRYLIIYMLRGCNYRELIISVVLDMKPCAVHTFVICKSSKLYVYYV